MHVPKEQAGTSHLGSCRCGDHHTQPECRSESKSVCTGSWYSGSKWPRTLHSKEETLKQEEEKKFVYHDKLPGSYFINWFVSVSFCV